MRRQERQRGVELAGALLRLQAQPGGKGLDRPPVHVQFSPEDAGLLQLAGQQQQFRARDGDARQQGDAGQGFHRRQVDRLHAQPAAQPQRVVDHVAGGPARVHLLQHHHVGARGLDGPGLVLQAELPDGVVAIVDVVGGKAQRVPPNREVLPPRPGQEQHHQDQRCAGSPPGQPHGLRGHGNRLFRPGRAQPWQRGEQPGDQDNGQSHVVEQVQRVGVGKGKGVGKAVDQEGDAAQRQARSQTPRLAALIRRKAGKEQVQRDPLGDQQQQQGHRAGQQAAKGEAQQKQHQLGDRLEAVHVGEGPALQQQRQQRHRQQERRDGGVWHPAPAAQGVGVVQQRRLQKKPAPPGQAPQQSHPGAGPRLRCGLLAEQPSGQQAQRQRDGYLSRPPTRPQRHVPGVAGGAQELVDHQGQDQGADHVARAVPQPRRQVEARGRDDQHRGHQPRLRVVDGQRDARQEDQRRTRQARHPPGLRSPWRSQGGHQGQQHQQHHQAHGGHGHCCDNEGIVDHAEQDRKQDAQCLVETDQDGGRFHHLCQVGDLAGAVVHRSVPYSAGSRRAR